jgi:regulator of sigma E protease
MILISFIVTISILVLIHEFGHFIIARFFKVHVEEFALGFGKTLFEFKDRYNTSFKFKAIMLGGYVKMHNDKDPASFEHENPVVLTKEDEEKSFYTKELYKKFLIVLGGPLFNYIFAIICFFVIFFAFGTYTPTCEIESVVEGSPAKLYGIEAGDVILKADNLEINKYSELQEYIALNGEKEIVFEILRSGIIKDVKVLVANKNGKGFVGISPKISEEKIKLSFVESIAKSVNFLIELNTLMIKEISKMISSGSIDGISGPIGVAKISNEAISYGLDKYIFFLGIISLSLGFMNLLPIPILDGGHLFMYMYQFLFKQEISQNTLRILFKVGLFVILTLTAIGFINDIKGLVKIYE